MKKLLTCMLLMVSVAAQAEWTYIDKSETSYIYVDTASWIKTSTGGKVWLMFDRFKPTVIQRETIASVKVQYQVDCAGQHVDRIFFVNYTSSYGRGIPTVSGPLPRNFRPIVPDTIGSDLFAEYCAP